MGPGGCLPRDNVNAEDTKVPGGGWESRQDKQNSVQRPGDRAGQGTWRGPGQVHAEGEGQDAEVSLSGIALGRPVLFTAAGLDANTLEGCGLTGLGYTECSLGSGEAGRGCTHLIPWLLGWGWEGYWVAGARLW